MALLTVLMICVVFVSRKSCAASTLLSTSPTVPWKGEERNEPQKERVGELSLFLAVPGASQCTDIDFLSDGLNALDGRVEVFLRAEAVDVYV